MHIIFLNGSSVIIIEFYILLSPDNVPILTSSHEVYVASLFFFFFFCSQPFKLPHKIPSGQCVTGYLLGPISVPGTVWT